MWHASSSTYSLKKSSESVEKTTISAKGGWKQSSVDPKQHLKLMMFLVHLLLRSHHWQLIFSWSTQHGKPLSRDLYLPNSQHHLVSVGSRQTQVMQAARWVENGEPSNVGVDESREDIPWWTIGHHGFLGSHGVCMRAHVCWELQAVPLQGWM